MKKIIVVLLILAVVLSGCGTTNDPETVDSGQRPLKAVDIKIAEGGHDSVRYGMTLEELVAVLGNWDREPKENIYSYNLDTQVLGETKATRISYDFSEDNQLSSVTLIVESSNDGEFDYYKLKNDWGKKLKSTYKKIKSEEECGSDVKDLAAMSSAEFNNGIDDGAFGYIGTWEMETYTFRVVFLTYTGVLTEIVGK